MSILSGLLEATLNSKSYIISISDGNKHFIILFHDKNRKFNIIVKVGT